MTPLGIFGTSGFAREVDDIACALDLRTVFIARDAAERDAWGRPGEVMLEADIGKGRGMRFAIGIGDPGLRRKVAQRHGATLNFVNLIHPTATFGRGQRALLDQQRGVTVCAGVRFMNSIQVGDFTVFSLNATIGHDCIVDDFVTIAPGVNISGQVHIGSACWLGTGAAINQGTAQAKLSIGTDTVIGSGAVVIRDCVPSAVYAGVPARRLT